MNMKMANITEAKNQLSRYVDAALRGEDVVICRRNVPLVRLVAVDYHPRNKRVFRYSDRAWRQRRLFRRLREEGACSKHVTDERKWLKRREPARRRENT